MSLRSFVMFLTRSLAIRYPITAVLAAQQTLLANLSHMPLPITLKLSASAPQDPAFENTGIPWSEWTALFGNHDLYFTVAENSVSMAFGAGADSPALVIWMRDVDQSTYVPRISKIKRTSLVDRSVRSISSTHPRAVKLPTLSSSIDDHSESDSDSEASDFSFSSSHDSLTSVSSRSPSPSESAKYVPPCKLQKTAVSSPISPRYLSRKYPTVDQNKKDTTKYLYQGGITTVLTGGVKLGGARTAPAQPKRKSVLLGPESNDWRRKN